jgi:hypothetical protein
MLLWFRGSVPKPFIVLDGHSTVVLVPRKSAEERWPYFRKDEISVCPALT